MLNKEQINHIFDEFYLANDLIFDGKRHSYTLGGISLAGVSSISEFRPSPELIGWAAKMVYEFLLDKQSVIKDCSPEEYAALLLEAKKMHRTKSGEAMDVGKRAHKAVEDYINGKKPEITEDIKNPFEQFLAFEKKHNVQWLATEKIVCSPEHLVGGTLDSLAIIDGVVSIADFKTSSSVRESYILQVSGYQMCLAEMGIPVEQRIILRLPKTKDDGFEAVLVDTPYEQDVQAFLAQREAYRWKNFIETKHCDKVAVKGYKINKLRLKTL